jgi:hypothetical protein
MNLSCRCWFCKKKALGFCTVQNPVFGDNGDVSSESVKYLGGSLQALILFHKISRAFYLLAELPAYD